MSAVASPRPWVALYDAGVPAEPAARHATVLRAFRHAAAAAPERVMLRYRDQAIDARALDRRSDALAAALSAGGFGRGERLAIQLQNVPEFVIGVLAAWKLGGIAVTVNPMYRERELEEVLRDSASRVLLCEADARLEATRAVAARCGVAQVIDCAAEPGADDGFKRLLATVGAATPDLGAEGRPDEPATFIYTSGTTGPLKAAVSTHAQIACSAEVYRSWAALQPGETIVAIAPLVHVTGMIGYIALALATPATLVLTYRFTPQAFRDAVRTYRASLTIGPTTAFIALTGAADVTADDLRSLDRPFSGGAPIPAAVVQRYRDKFGHRILGIYGLTEATGPTHMVPRGRAAPLDTASGTLAVGLPVPGLDCRIDGAGGVPMRPGEIVLRGPQIASGYWRHPEESTATFAADGLHTGDVGVMDAEGWLYVIDRLKDQINASGFKVWPREVEEVLYEHAAVLECAVVGLQDDYRGETVAAFVVLRPDRKAGADTLESFCRERLAAYKVPRMFRFLPELPKTASGKVLRRELKARAG